jgi:hypothetical protein
MLGTLEGIRFPGIFKRKRKFIWIPFLDTEGFKVLSMGPSGTAVKGQSSVELIPDCGAQRSSLYGLGASGRKDSNPMQINQFGFNS